MATENGTKSSQNHATNPNSIAGTASSIPENLPLQYSKEEFQKIVQENENLLVKLKKLQRTKIQAKQLLSLYNATHEQLMKSQENERALRSYIQTQQQTMATTEMSSLTSELLSLKTQFERTRILTQIQQERINNLENEISQLRQLHRDYESQINAKEILIAQLKSELKKAKDANEQMERECKILQKENDELKQTLQLERQKQMMSTSDHKNVSSSLDVSPSRFLTQHSNDHTSASSSIPLVISSEATQGTKMSSLSRFQSSKISKDKQQETDLDAFEQQLIRELEEGEIPKIQPSEDVKKTSPTKKRKRKFSKESKTSNEQSDQSAVFVLDTQQNLSLQIPAKKQHCDRLSSSPTEGNELSTVKFAMPIEWEEEQRILRTLVAQQRQERQRLESLRQRDTEPDVHYVARLLRLVAERKNDTDDVLADVVTLLSATLSPRNLIRGFRMFLTESSVSLAANEMNASNDTKTFLSLALKGVRWEYDIVLILWNLSERLELSLDTLTKKLGRRLIDQRLTNCEAILIARFIALICRVTDNKRELAQFCSELLRWRDSPFTVYLLAAVYAVWPQIFSFKQQSPTNRPT
jgi:myosin heavy subunit